MIRTSGRLRQGSSSGAGCYALLALLAVACVTPSSSGTDKGGEEGSGDDGGSGSGTTIYDIQRGDVEVDTQVTLTRVIVTSPLDRDGEGFYVSEPDGGEYSGVYVFLGGGGLGDTFLSVGDEVTIAGTVAEFYDSTQVVATAESVEVTGTGSVAPTVVSAVSDWEPYEGVLVQMDDQEVTACIDSYGQAPLSGGIQMDDDLFLYETERGATYDAVVGIIAYSFEQYRLNPRDQADLSGYVAGVGCTTTIANARAEGLTGSADLQGVIVTSLPTRDFGFFIQDEGGGPGSGVYVFTYEDVIAGLDLQVGDKIDISGSFEVFYDFLELKITSVDAVVEVGTGEPVAEVLTEAPTDWEPYEGGLVTLIDADITSDVNDYGEVSTSYGVPLDDWFFQFDLSNGDLLPEATGLVSYSFEAFKVCPRDTEDLSGAGGDGGGGDGGTGGVATVNEVQTGAVSGIVTLENVVATSVSVSGKGFFVQDAGGGEYSGIYVYTDTTAVTVAVGDVLTITGEVDEYYDLTELKVTDAADVVKSGTASVTATTLSAEPSDWEPYEGVLVTISGGLSLTGDADSYGVAATSWSSLFVDDLLYDYDGTYGSGDSFPTATGLIDYSFSQWKLLPRSAADLGM